MTIEYMGVKFIVYLIESNKLYIKDMNGNPIGYVLKSDNFKVV